MALSSQACDTQVTVFPHVLLFQFLGHQQLVYPLLPSTPPIPLNVIRVVETNMLQLQAVQFSLIFYLFLVVVVKAFSVRAEFAVVALAAECRTET